MMNVKKYSIVLSVVVVALFFYHTINKKSDYDTAAFAEETNKAENLETNQLKKQSLEVNNDDAILQENKSIFVQDNERVHESELASANNLEKNSSKKSDSKNLLEPTKEQRVKLEENFNKLFNVAKEKDWDKLLNSDNFLEEQNLDDTDFLTFALLQAVINDAPFSVILEFINRGAKLSSDVLFVLSSKQNVELALKLENLGLKYTAVDQEGRNALYYAMTNLNKRDMFEFLLTRGVSPKRTNDKNDLILRALDGCPIYKNSPYFVERLLQKGEKIMAIHRSKYTDLVFNNALCLKKLMPIFANN
jgi:hypothetical protein